MRRTRQRGQAMVFGLLFMGITVIALIMLFNQGILTRDRVQLENAADAAAYSQAKLFARHQNLIAYTNRAIVANELSIGQVVALMSWSKRYAEIPRWVNSFPAYQVPILLIPPKPSIADVLSTVTLPYQILGHGVRAVSTPAMTIYPPVVSSYNVIMGFFQKAFAIATIEAQARIPSAIVEQHRMDKPGDTLEVAPLSSMLLVQNVLLTYFADSLPDQLVDALEMLISSRTDSDDPDDAQLLADFTGAYKPGSMLVNLAPEMHNKSKEKQEQKDELTASEASRFFAATINEQRNDWLSARNFDAAAGFQTPTIRLPLGFINISFSFGFEVGVFNNGGTAYVYNPLSTSNAGRAVPVFGWNSLDFSSMGFKLDVELAIEICLPLVGCATIFDDGINFGLGLPLGGATHQLVTSLGDNVLFAPQWGTPLQGALKSAPRPYGDAMHPVHAVTYGWGNVVLPTPTIYGNVPSDVNTGYSGSPSFFTLGSDHAESGRSKEFTVAVSKPLSAVRTSDNPNGLNLRPVADDGNVLNRRGRFALQTESDTTTEPFWGAGERMMTISSAETYFAPPPGRTESPNQHSPFWDARLREPSRVVQYIASSDINLAELLSPSALASALVDLIEPGRDRLLDKLPTVIRPVVKPILEKITDEVLEKAKEGIEKAL